MVFPLGRTGVSVLTDRSVRPTGKIRVAPVYNKPALFSQGITMPRDLILGTAGHIDHGKTALVKALTGIDCDRLPEEKARGITIDIGFATLDLPTSPLAGRASD